MAINAGPYTGRYASVRASTSGLYSDPAVEMLGKWDLTITFDDIDASVFGSVWKKNLSGMQGWTAKFDGFYSISTAANSTGQQTLQQAALNQTKIQDIRFMLNSSGDGSTGWYAWMPNKSSSHADVTNYSTTAGAYIGNISIGQDKSGLGTVSYDVKGFGPIGLFYVTSSDGTYRAMIT